MIQNCVVLVFNKPTVLNHVRLNQGVQGVKQLKARLIDSTYLNASDPNSMRDLGTVRNAEYHFGISSN